MQVFLAYPNLTKSIYCLDNRRSVKQPVEVNQILKALSGQSMAWINHPITKMFRGCERFLIRYGLIACKNLRDRNYKDSFSEKIKAFSDIFANRMNCPKWFGDEKFHASHRAALLFKGWMDKTCEAIPTKSKNKWLVENGFPKKNEFKTIEQLKTLQDKLCYYPTLEETHYAQFNWNEEPEINYFWPEV